MKKYYLYIIVVALCLIFIFAILRTNKNRNENNDTIFYTINDKGEIKYLSQDDVEVVLVKELVNNHAIAVDTRTFEGINFSEEYKFYAEEFKIIVAKNENNIKKFYEQNKLVTQHYDITFKSVEFDYKMERAEVKVMDRYKFTEVYENSPLIKYKNVVFTQQRKYILELIEDTWKVIDIITDREE